MKKTKKKLWLYVPFIILLLISAINIYLSIYMNANDISVQIFKHPSLYRYWYTVNSRLNSICGSLNLNFNTVLTLFYAMAPVTALMSIYGIAMLIKERYKGYKLDKRTFLLLIVFCVALLLCIGRLFALDAIADPTVNSVSNRTLCILIELISMYATALTFLRIVSYFREKAKLYAGSIMTILESVLFLPFSCAMLTLTIDELGIILWTIIAAVMAVLLIAPMKRQRKAKSRSAENVDDE